jgi:hypothetical protein
MVCPVPRIDRNDNIFPSLFPTCGLHTKSALNKVNIQLLPYHDLVETQSFIPQILIKLAPTWRNAQRDRNTMEDA